MGKYERGELSKTQVTTGGWIATKKRGQGIHTLLEATTKEMLQIYANANNKEVIWAVGNANKDMLENLEVKQLNENESLEDVQYEEFLLDQKRAEQEAWLAVYGKGGRLGFDLSKTENAKKTLLPRQGSKEFTQQKMELSPQDLSVHGTEMHYDVREEYNTWEETLSSDSKRKI